LPHRNVGDEHLEIVASGHLRTGHTQIAVECANGALRPAQRESLLAQRVLAFGTFPMLAHLRQGRLAHVNGGRFALVNLADLGAHRRAPR
jgi:hypothetical protein